MPSIDTERSRSPVRRRQKREVIMMAKHKRNTGPMLGSLRCGAKTRSGNPCSSPAVKGKRRCRMHGGAAGSGAPRGNQNALKHGLHTQQAIAERRQIGELLRKSRKLLVDLG